MVGSEKTIAYTCPYVPAEWITAHGLQPRRLIPQPMEGTSAIPRIEGLCPYARAFANDVAASEDVDGIWLDQAITPYPYVYLSTLGNFSVTGISGANEDIFVFKPTALGSTTAGSFATALYLDGSLFGLSSYDIDAFDVRR